MGEFIAKVTTITQSRKYVQLTFAYLKKFFKTFTSTSHSKANRLSHTIKFCS